MTRRLLLFALALVLALPAHAADTEITVLAASSLTEALQAVAAKWTAAGHPQVTFSFDASSRLAKQIEAASPADLFFSADTDWMDYLDQRGLIAKATRLNLLGNALVVVVPATSTATFGSVKHLSRPEVKHLALAAETVPAGKYARAALTSAGAWEAVKDRVVNGENVRTVLGWVASKEADAGFVYATDAKIEPKVKVALTVPAASYPPIVYPAAVVRSAAHAKEAAEFLAYCRSADGMAVFLAAGFTSPPLM
jgi:molybdate transport system substrate-binding protein